MLNKKNEEPWVPYIETNPMGKLQLTDKFFAYKQNIVTLRETLEKHFNTCMNNIRKGLPDVIEEAKDDKDYTFDGTNVGSWTCRVCIIKNDEK